MRQKYTVCCQTFYWQFVAGEIDLSDIKWLHTYRLRVVSDGKLYAVQ